MRPTLDEVRAAIAEKGYTHVDAEEFWSYWESMDWKRGRIPIKNWKAALMNRERQLKLRGDYGVTRSVPSFLTERHDPAKSDHIASPEEKAEQERLRFELGLPHTTWRLTDH